MIYPPFAAAFFSRAGLIMPLVLFIRRVAMVLVVMDIAIESLITTKVAFLSCLAPGLYRVAATTLQEMTLFIPPAVMAFSVIFWRMADRRSYGAF